MEKRFYRISEICDYLQLGKTKAREFCKQIGADVHIGRTVRYDIKVEARSSCSGATERRYQWTSEH